MSRLLISAFFLILSACSPKGEEQVLLPPPGRDARPQIYALFEKPREEAAANWLRFPAQGWTESLGARFELFLASSEKETADRLHEWNARPVDLLILGPGWPQALWKSLKLAQGKAKKIFFLWPEAPLGSQDWSLLLASADVEKFVQEFCGGKAKTLGCSARVYGAVAEPAFHNLSFDQKSAKIVNFGDVRAVDANGKESAMNVTIAWTDIVRGILQDRLPPGTVTASFANAYVGATVGERYPAPERKKAEAFLQEWKLKELSRDR